MTRMLVVFALLGLALGACSKPAETDAGEETAATEKAAEKAPEKAAEKAAEKAPEEPAGHPVWGAYDTAAELAKLDGKWLVKARFGQKEADTWEIAGGKVTITKAGGEAELGKLVMKKPGSIGVKSGDSTTYYAFARDGETVYLGLGDGGVKHGETYLVGDDWGVVVFDGKACKYHRQKMAFGDEALKFKDPVDVKCELQTGGDKTILHYQVLKFRKDDEFEDKQIHVKGNALVNDQLSGGAISKAP